MKKIIIAGTQSNAGKTTVTTALMGAFKKRGLKISPFKVGPDYIDPKFHQFVTGRASHNLDSWMLDEETIKQLFIKNSASSEMSIIEGVMGLFDGQGTGHRGSTAHVAEILNAPIILVVNARGMSRSIVAIIQGYVNFNKKINIKGVILNNISSNSHYTLLKDIIDKNCSLECLGYLPSQKDIMLSNRHLGLVPVEELKDIKSTVETMASMAEQHIDLDRIEEIAQSTKPVCKAMPYIAKGEGRGITIAIARDKAFSFYYNDNLKLMKESGMSLVEFSPMEDSKIPENAHALYLGGGFPEVFAHELSQNIAMLENIKTKLTNNMPAYAECGGLIYLTRGIISLEGNFFPMVNFFNCKTVMTEKLQRFGYVEVKFMDTFVKAHEFHHTRLEEIDDDEIKYSYDIKKSDKNLIWQGGMRKKNVLAGYPHIHFYSNIDFFRKITDLYRGKLND